MDAATIARIMAPVPARTAWTHSGCSFVPHEGQCAELRYVAPFLHWLSPLAELSKDDQRALGLLAPKPSEQEDESAPGEDGLEPLEVVDDAPLGGAGGQDALLPVLQSP
jgi:hypothetical protein